MKCSNYEDQSATAFSICVCVQLGNLFGDTKMQRVLNMYSFSIRQFVQQQ